MSLKGKKIIIGITGSIAAYKTAFLVRLLKKSGALVKVIMTEAATNFISPLTLSTLSEEDVILEYAKENGTWNNHVELGLWADLMLIAPASANTLAKMAHGLCDNVLLATYLSAKCPVWIAPAMDLDMFAHPSTQLNLKTLATNSNRIIEPTSGELASGLVGQGRMEEPEEIHKLVLAFFEKKKSLAGRKFLITAGPTHEEIDPVRFIGNHSSGKMGFALAKEAANRGANVTLVTGPVELEIFHPNIKRIDVTSATDMFEACKKAFPKTNVVIKAAAVADFKPANVSKKKIKTKSKLNIELEENPDIIAYLGKKKKKQILVGFALENDKELEYAKGKITKKNLDMIVLNSLRDKGAGFGHNTNKVTLIDKKFNQKKLPLLSKTEVASHILDEVEKLLE